ncbi:FecR family protein [Flavobacterium algicola]|uniref:FecR family protein n=1 Tax=Flavobacterium algicola TaxID=556529 RepID=UPI001EFE540C|nr:FecR family protein [Flavobacterium algicola]MCG9792565.1 FecR family protein [Flavobacterium algicola]
MTRKIKHTLEQLIEKSLQKTATRAEEELLENFMRKEYDESSLNTLTTVKGQDFHSFVNRSKKRKRSRYTAYGIAASVLIIIGIGFTAIKPTIIAPQMITVHTGKTADSVHLVDGSVIYLAANSVFEYPEKFELGERNVKLSRGKAFFEVAKDSLHPFIIHSGDVKTRVVGTSFHIQMSKGKCNVIVATGKVNVSAENQNVDLLPNEAANFENNKLVKNKVSKLLVVNWYSRDVDLKNVKLFDAFEFIENKYDVHFDSSSNTVRNTSLTLFIEKNASLENILLQMNYITNLKFKTNENTITVY